MEKNIQKDMQVNFTDYSQITRLMKTYGNSNHMFFGENENGESITISVQPNSVTVETLQHNGWTRINTYYENGTIEEMFRR